MVGQAVLLAAHVFLLLLAAVQTYIFVLEAFWWTSPKGRKVFGTTEQQAQDSKVLALNQGAYNLLLAAGIGVGVAWDLLRPGSQGAWALELSFAACVMFAGFVGAATAKRTILFVQSLPAAIAIALLCASHF